PLNCGPPPPPSCSTAPSTSTRTYGPAGTSTVTLAPATVKVSFTDPVPVFTFKLMLPPVRVTPGTVRLALTANDAATPCAVTITKPLPLFTETKVFVPSPNCTDNFVTPIFSTDT